VQQEKLIVKDTRFWKYTTGKRKARRSVSPVFNSEENLTRRQL